MSVLPVFTQGFQIFFGLYTLAFLLYLTSWGGRMGLDLSLARVGRR